MQRSSFILLATLVLIGSSAAFLLADSGWPGESCRGQRLRAEGEKPSGRCRETNAACGPEMRGRCGKARKDCYGARKPVTSEREAREQLEHFYEGEAVTVAALAEKELGFEATILDQNGRVVDKVFIDKRSGRVRSRY